MGALREAEQLALLGQEGERDDEPCLKRGKRGEGTDGGSMERAGAALYLFTFHF